MPPPPPIKSGLGGFTCLSWVILAENLDDLMLAHIEGREGNLPVGTHMKLEDARSPRWGTRCANCWTPFVSLRPSLWLLWVALT
jgi:hypothetical protein